MKLKWFNINLYINLQKKKCRAREETSKVGLGYRGFIFSHKDTSKKKVFSSSVSYVTLVS